MARYADTVPSVRSQADTFDYLARFSNTAEWDPGAVAGRDHTDGGEVGVGSRFSLDFKMAGREQELEYEVVEYERPNRIRLVCHKQAFTSDDTIVVEPDGRGARVTYDAVVDLRGPLRVFDPLLKLGFKRAGSQAAAGLERTLSRSA